MAKRVFTAFLLGSAAALSAGTAHAAVTLVNPIYFEDFDTLISTGTATVPGALPNGFEFLEVGTNANRIYTAGTGSSNAGDTYSFGAAGSTDRALGTLLSGTLQSRFGVQLINGLNRTITALNISYVGEQFRLGTINRADRLAFSYSTNATTLNNGTYINLTDLDFSSPTTTGTTGALNGNAAANQAVRVGTIAGLELLAGQSIFLRFLDIDVNGADDGLGVDNFRVEAVTLAAVPEPATWAMMITGFGFVGGALRQRRRAAAKLA